MHYVYLLKSQLDCRKRYIGVTSDLGRRLAQHNSGRCVSTRLHTPWTLESYLAFSSRERAFSFERYLKSGSGAAFANKRLWSP
jgi:predicted GIY-YIG superfamily endonuclease